MSVKNGARTLIYDTGFRNIKKELVKKYGNSVAEQIWQKAGTNLEELSRQYEHLPKAVKLHTDGNMFRNAAVYMAIKEYDPEDALNILDEGVKKEGARVAKLLSILLHIPGMKVVMLRVFSRMLTSFFGEDAQFKSIRHCNSDMEISFDIIQCPYCKYSEYIRLRPQWSRQYQRKSGFASSVHFLQNNRILVQYSMTFHGFQGRSFAAAAAVGNARRLILRRP